MRLAAYLTGGSSESPPEYLRYRLRQMYRIPPSVLAEQKGEFLFEMLRDLQCEKWETKAARLKASLNG